MEEYPKRDNSFSVGSGPLLFNIYREEGPSSLMMLLLRKIADLCLICTFHSFYCYTEVLYVQYGNRRMALSIEFSTSTLQGRTQKPARFSSSSSSSFWDNRLS